MLESCDTNILLYALSQASPQHARARAYLDSHAANEDFVLSELVLVELYMLLRNPVVVTPAVSAQQAVATVEMLRANRRWMIVDYPGAGIMNRIWRAARQEDFPKRAIFDMRIALSLRHYGVKRFATHNRKHFESYGFQELIDPVE